MSSRTLITGGAGFIGSSLAKRLLERGDEVVIYDSFSPQIHGPDAHEGVLFDKIGGEVELFRNDIRDKEALRKSLVDVDRVVHLAAETGTGQSMYDIDNYVSVNLGGTGVLLDIVANDSIELDKLVVASSRAVYGEGKYRCDTDGDVFPESRSPERMLQSEFEPQCPVCGESVTAVPTDEASKKHPSSLYGITKAGQEDMCLNVGAALSMPTAALRFQNVFGPGQSLRNPYTGILSIFSTRILNGNEINIYEDGLESRDFVYIDDIVTSTIAALNSDHTDQRAINVGSGRPVSVIDVVRLLSEYLGHPAASSVSGNFRVGDIRHNFADLTLAEEYLGFRPSVTFEVGLRAFAEWVLRQAREEDTYDQSAAELRAKGLLQ